LLHFICKLAQSHSDCNSEGLHPPLLALQPLATVAIALAIATVFYLCCLCNYCF